MSHPHGSHSFLGRYLWSRTRQVTPPTVQPAAQVAGAGLQDVMLSHTYVARRNIINVARFSANLIHGNPEVSSGLRNSDFGINLPNANSRAAGLTTIAVTGYFDGATRLGDPFRILLGRVNEVFQFANEVTWLRGRHSWKFGVDLRRDRIKMDLVQRPNGSIILSGAITGNGAADFLLGVASQFSISTTQAVQDRHSWVYAGYAHDEFRISPALTLDVGVRYELPFRRPAGGDCRNRQEQTVRAVPGCTARARLPGRSRRGAWRCAN